MLPTTPRSLMGKHAYKHIRIHTHAHTHALRHTYTGVCVCTRTHTHTRIVIIIPFIVSFCNGSADFGRSVSTAPSELVDLNSKPLL